MVRRKNLRQGVNPCDQCEVVVNEMNDHTHVPDPAVVRARQVVPEMEARAGSLARRISR